MHPPGRWQGVCAIARCSMNGPFLFLWVLLWLIASLCAFSSVGGALGFSLMGRVQRRRRFGVQKRRNRRYFDGFLGVMRALFCAAQLGDDESDDGAWGVENPGAVGCSGGGCGVGGGQ